MSKTNGYLKQKVEMIATDQLNVDRRYQRGKKEQWVKHIVRHFDPKLFSPLIVSRRPNGRMFIIDGQQRWNVATILEIEHVPCEILNIKTVQEESRIFQLLNTERRSVNNFELYWAKLTAKDPDAIGLKKLMTEHGLELWMEGTSLAVSWPEFVCIGALQRAYKFGSEHMSRMLNIMIDAFDSDDPPHGCNHSFMVNGISMFMRLAEYNFDDARLVAALQKYQPKEILQMSDAAKMIMAGRNKALGHVICKIYNDQERGGRIDLVGERKRRIDRGKKREKTKA